MIRPTLAALSALAIAPSAFAQDAGSNAGPSAGSTWSVSAGVASDNRSKDASKSMGEPFAWVESEWESPSQLFYAGSAAETIKSSTGSELEVELNAGYRPQLLGFDLDLNAAHKWQLDANPGADAEAWEFTADVTRSIGPASARLRLQHSPDGTGSTEAWTWLAFRAGWDLSDKLNLTAEIGRREQDNSVDYTGGNVGVSYALTRNLELDVRYHATDANGRGEQYADALVAGLSVSF